MGVAMLMAIAFSLDGFGVGLAYGLRRIRIPIGSLLVIALCTVLAMGTSMLFGSWVSLGLTFIPAELLGAAFLIGMGGFQLIRAIGKRKDEALPQAVPAMTNVTTVVREEPLEPVFRFHLSLFGLVIQVLRTPDIADMDGSGGISLRESFLLGSALAMDAFAGGIGAAMAGMALWIVGVVAVTQMMFLGLGHKLAGKFPEHWADKADYLPGVVLIAVGLIKLI